MKPLRYEYLTADRFPQIYTAFVEAFSDYAVDMSAVTEAALRNRMIKNGVDFATSAAAYDGERMVGFALTGLDLWEGAPAAFDACTGVVPGYRGMGVAPGIFELVLKTLRAHGLRRYLLEVLQQNRPAVGTYRKLGFRVTREFDCYELPLDRARRVTSPALPGLSIEPVDRDSLPAFVSFLDRPPSWENSFASIARIPDAVSLYGARHTGSWVGFAAHYPGLNWILNLSVDRAHRRRGIATRLLERVLRDLDERLPRVKLVNVDHSDDGARAWLERIGFEIYARQYEMALELQNSAPASA